MMLEGVGNRAIHNLFVFRYGNIIMYFFTLFKNAVHVHILRPRAKNMHSVQQYMNYKLFDLNHDCSRLKSMFNKLLLKHTFHLPSVSFCNYLTTHAKVK